MIRNNQFRVSVVLAFIVLFCSCASQDWKMARQQNTVESYEHFLRQNPDSEFDKEARLALTNAIERRHEATAKFCEKWSKLKLGMSSKEVAKIMGLQQAIFNTCNIMNRVQYKNNPWIFEFEDCKLVKWSSKVGCEK